MSASSARNVGFFVFAVSNICYQPPNTGASSGRLIYNRLCCPGKKCQPTRQGAQTSTVRQASIPIWR
jgi:hypothetical protein